MIAHALTIVKNEFDRHLSSFNMNGQQVELGNVGELAANANAQARNKILLSVANVIEERTLKNDLHYTRDDVTAKVLYANPPVYLNVALLVTATHSAYADALVSLSRAIAFFQFRNTFTHDSVDPASITSGAPLNPLDRLIEFKLIVNLASPTLEEVNHLWGTFGGKQYPFALYTLRMLEMRFPGALSEGSLISETVGDFVGLAPVAG